MIIRENSSVIHRTKIQKRTLNSIFTDDNSFFVKSKPNQIAINYISNISNSKLNKKIPINNTNTYRFKNFTQIKSSTHNNSYAKQKNLSVSSNKNGKKIVAKNTKLQKLLQTLNHKKNINSFTKNNSQNSNNKSANNINNLYQRCPNQLTTNNKEYKNKKMKLIKLSHNKMRKININKNILNELIMKSKKFSLNLNNDNKKNKYLFPYKTNNNLSFENSLKFRCDASIKGKNNIKKSLHSVEKEKEKSLAEKRKKLKKPISYLIRYKYFNSIKNLYNPFYLRKMKNNFTINVNNNDIPSKAKIKSISTNINTNKKIPASNKTKNSNNYSDLSSKHHILYFILNNKEKTNPSLFHNIPTSRYLNTLPGEKNKQKEKEKEKEESFKSKSKSIRKKTNVSVLQKSKNILNNYKYLYTLKFMKSRVDNNKEKTKEIHKYSLTNINKTNNIIKPRIKYSNLCINKSTNLFDNNNTETNQIETDYTENIIESSSLIKSTRNKKLNRKYPKRYNQQYLFIKKMNINPNIANSMSHFPNNKQNIYIFRNSKYYNNIPEMCLKNTSDHLYKNNSTFCYFALNNTDNKRSKKIYEKINDDQENNKRRNTPNIECKKKYNFSYVWENSEDENNNNEEKEIDNFNDLNSIVKKINFSLVNFSVEEVFSTKTNNTFYEKYKTKFDKKFDKLFNV